MIPQNDSCVRAKSQDDRPPQYWQSHGHQIDRVLNTLDAAKVTINT